MASPGFGARRGRCKCYLVLQEATVDIIVAVRLCTDQSAPKKVNCCKSRGHVPQCPVAGDANGNVRMTACFSSVRHPPGHFPSRTFPLTKIINLTLTPTLTLILTLLTLTLLTLYPTLILLTPLLTLALTEQGRGNIRGRNCPRGNCPFPCVSPTC